MSELVHVREEVRATIHFKSSNKHVNLPPMDSDLLQLATKEWDVPCGPNEEKDHSIKIRDETGSLDSIPSCHTREINEEQMSILKVTAFGLDIRNAFKYDIMAFRIIVNSFMSQNPARPIQIPSPSISAWGQLLNLFWIKPSPPPYKLESS